MRITRTTKSPVITKENTAAGPAALMTTPLPTKRPAPMTPPSAIIVMCRCFKLRRRAGPIVPMLTGEWKGRGEISRRYGKIHSQPQGTSMFRYFENLVPPYPDAAPPELPRGFFAFLWACARGARRYIAAMTLLTAAIGVFEALLFSILGRVVDLLAKVEPSRLWIEQRAHILL